MQREIFTIRRSIGIACCRKNITKEILLVQRRVTYAFQDLIFGRYKLKSISKIKYLIKNMTADEQSELITKQFDHLWWRAAHFLPTDNINLFNSKFEKFTNMDNKYNLVSLIKESSCVQSLWEIPKGKHKSDKETDLNCAIREFEEETSVRKNMYRLIFNPVNYCYQENNTTYSINYYAAIALSNFVPRLHAERQLCEVVDVRWMSLPMIKLLGNIRLYNLVKRIFRII